MIPDFTDEGLLPPGVHRATQEEFQQRFVIFDRSDRRLRVYEGLKRLLKDARRSGIVRRLIVVGSYITAKAEPNDFDCIVVCDSTFFRQRLAPYQYNMISRQRCRRTYKGDVLSVADGSAALQKNLEYFQRDRSGNAMGVVEIEL
jgi:hypothetical protein